MSRRIRSLKPEILEDEKTAGMSDTAFRIFVGLITMADDFGSFRADPRLIERAVYWVAVPERAVDIALRELGDTCIVEFYSVRGQRYGRFVNWAKHQRVDNASAKRYGTLPGPEEAESRRLAATRGEVESQLSSPPLDEKLALESAARARAPDRIGSDRIGEEQREPHTAPPVVPIQEIPSETRLKQVPPSPLMPHEAEIQAAIREHPKLADLDAADLAQQACTYMLAKGMRVEWILQAIADASDKSQRGETLQIRHSRVVGFMRHAKPPKADEREQKSGPAYREFPVEQDELERARRLLPRRAKLDETLPVSTDEQRARAMALVSGIGKGGT